MKNIFRSFFLLAVLSSLWACNKNASSVTSQDGFVPTGTNPGSTTIVDGENENEGRIKGMLIAQKPIVNLGYRCGYGEVIKEGKTESDDTLFEYATFDCPVLSDSIQFYIGDNIDKGLIIGTFPFYDMEVKALNTISLVDFIDANKLLNYEHPYVTNVALLLDAISLRDHQGAMNEVLRIPDEIHKQVSLWVVSQGEGFDSTTSFFNRAPELLSTALFDRGFQEVVVETANAGSGPVDQVVGLVDTASNFSANIAAVVSDLEEGGRVLYTGIYPMSLLTIFDGTNIVSGDVGLYIDRAGRTFGYGSLIDVTSTDVDGGEVGAPEIIYFKKPILDPFAPEQPVAAACIEEDLEFIGYELTDSGCLDNALSLQGTVTDTRFDLTGRIIRRMLFYGNYSFSDTLPLYSFHTVSEKEAGRFSSDSNRHNISYTGGVAMKQEKQVAPLIPQPILASFDFPLHYSITLYRKPWFHEDWDVDDLRLKMSTLSVTFLKDGNIITDLDGDCAAVDFDTLTEVEGTDVIQGTEVITEIPLGFLGHGNSVDLSELLEAADQQAVQRTAQQEALLAEVTVDGVILQYVTVALSFSHERIIGLGDSTGLPEAYALEAQMGLELYGSFSPKSLQFLGSQEQESLLALDWYNKKRVYIELSEALSDLSAGADDEEILRMAEDTEYEGIVKGELRSCF